MTARVAFVTGASRGIGAACASALGAAGHRVAVGWHRDAEGAQATVDVIEGGGGDALALPVDVVDGDSVAIAIDRIVDAFGPVDVLVSNAGITLDGVFARMSEQRWRSVLGANLDGAYHVTRRVVPAMMRNRWGRIITISSVAAYAGAAGQANYAASKAGLIGLTRALARELGPRNITANVVAPGAIATDMTAALDQSRIAAITAAVPLGRIGSAADVAAVVAFLASDAAGYVTGTVVPVDGGLGMGF